MLPRSLPMPALCLTALTLAGCQPKESAHSAPGAAPATTAVNAPTVLRVRAADFSFEAPDSITAGLTTIRFSNKGPSPHHVELIKLEQGKTLQDFLTALKAGGPPPAWASMIGGPNDPESGDSSTAIITLDPGSYAIICLIPGVDGVPHVMKGMAHLITVTGPARTTPEPTADVQVKLSDYDFQFSQPLTAGHHLIRVENVAQQVHELVLVRLESGKKVEDVAAWAAKMIGPPPGAIHGGTSGIMPGGHLFIETDLPPGDYGLICFFPDMHDGKPHLAHGMMKTIKVS
jgi:hypothetical protein